MAVLTQIPRVTTIRAKREFRRRMQCQDLERKENALDARSGGTPSESLWEEGNWSMDFGVRITPEEQSRQIPAMPFNDSSVQS
ncbi:hypothetical protein VTN77DRAFT_1551 [Rasamsonia byssochlamydoides]|uniref:uncharacterized protein n=1 Tax=Rasamsonia byssochlamydoides TaxID=89139 RepID=UPI00374429D4